MLAKIAWPSAEVPASSLSSSITSGIAIVDSNADLTVGSPNLPNSAVSSAGSDAERCLAISKLFVIIFRALRVSGLPANWTIALRKAASFNTVLKSANKERSDRRRRMMPSFSAPCCNISTSSSSIAFRPKFTTTCPSLSSERSRSRATLVTGFFSFVNTATCRSVSWSCRSPFTVSAWPDASKAATIPRISLLRNMSMRLGWRSSKRKISVRLGFPLANF
mmetsp:Transcript_15589/g.39538  ORF Transcript_15589/g.39538 Transcript_15589/m.39538 type:complete len:221 (+) Transcript_15589:1342-2004(+)